TKDVAKGLKGKTLVVYETTLPVGDTRGRIAPILEASKLKAGDGFYLAFSPERVSSGRIFKDLKEIPKIVGGVNEKSTGKAVEFYEKVLDCEVIPVSDCETAEAVKLFGMTYRDVNIALANEFAKFAQARGIDALDAINASNTNPYSHILTPGVGVGGHCAPVYPYFLLKKAKDYGVDLILPKDARKINDRMPGYAVGLLEKELGGLSGRRILVLGLAYRGGVKEVQFSPSIDVSARLNENKSRVFIHDPLFDAEELRGYGEPVELNDLPKLDGVILVTAHKEYEKLDLEKLKSVGVKVFVDGRNFLDKKKFDELGILYRGVGRF
ncbi:MAG: nucleotide sugar dehydrogenase, partial [Methanobacteriota archaeon]